MEDKVLFVAEPEFIEALDSKQLVQLMKRLLLAEGRLTGVPLRAATVPLQITVPDGGEDGRVEWTGSHESTPYFPARFTIFQSKAQGLTAARVRAEVAKKVRGKPAKLSEAISEVIAASGAYVVFCHKPMIETKKKVLKKAIHDAIKEAGGKTGAITVEIYDANLIADWTNRHPSVALWLASSRASRNLAGFQSHDGWAKAADNAVPWRPSEEPRFAPVNRVVPAVERKDNERSSWTFEQAASEILDFIGLPGKAVRVFGPSGFGKSRFVFEVLNKQRDIADSIDTASVIHCDGSISGDEVVKLALEAANAEMAAILVVDECSDELHHKIANAVKRQGSALRLITIDIETKVLQAADTMAVRVEKADDKLIGDIAKGVSPSLNDAAKSFITSLAEGFPRMAVLAAQQDGEGRQTLESVEQVLERIIWSGKPRNVEAHRALEIASLFEWIGIQGRVEAQGSFLAAVLAGQTPNMFVEHLLSFKSRGIITQRGDFLQVGPVPLAARLGLARLDLMTAEQLLDFFGKAPEELKSSLLIRLKWLDTSSTAAAFADRLLQPDLLGNFEALNTEAGSKALDRLVHVAPDSAAQAIDRVFGDFTVDELKAAEGARRFLVWSLEKLVFRRKTFDRAARLLKRLAIAETENFANNSTGLFKQLYHLYLSGTEAEPAARLVILDDGLASPDDTERKICIDALSEMLDTGHFSRSGGSEQIGSAEALRDWQPKTYSEIWDFHRAAMSRLVAVATSNDVHAALAQQHLGTHIRGLLSQLPPEEVREMIEKVSTHRGFWPQAFTGISHWLHYDQGKKTPKDVSERIRSMYDELFPTDLVEQAVLYTQGWQLDLHDPDSKYGRGTDAKHDFEYSSRQAKRVAEGIAKDEALSKRAVQRLACSDGNSIYPFSKSLMKSVSSPIAVFDEAVATANKSANPPNRGFFGGLISGADERDPALARSFIEKAMKSPKLKAEAVALIGSGRLEAEEIELVISLIQSGDVQPWECQNLGIFRADLPIVLPLLEELENHGSEGVWTILTIVNLYLHGDARPVSRKLVALVKRVLLNSALVQGTRDQMDGYHLETLIKWLVERDEVNKRYAGQLARQLLTICRQGGDKVFYRLDDPVRKVLDLLTSLHPQTVWDEIAKKLTSKNWHTRFYVEQLLESQYRIDEDHLARGLAFHVPAEQFLTWIRSKPQERAATAIDWLPIAERNEDSKLSWHPELIAFIDEFGDVPGVWDALHLRLRPKSWVGGLAPYLEPIVPLVESWQNHRKPNVRTWASKQLRWLDHTIREERKRSEEDAVLYS